MRKDSGRGLENGCKTGTGSTCRPQTYPQHSISNHKFPVVFQQTALHLCTNRTWGCAIRDCRHDCWYRTSNIGACCGLDCSEFANPAYQGIGPDSDCSPPAGPADAYLTIGQPRNIYHVDGSLIDQLVTFSSEDFGNGLHVVNIRLKGRYFITLKNPSRSLNVELYRCWDGTKCHDSNTTADGVPSTYYSRIIVLKSSDGAFTVDLEFNTTLSADYICSE